MKLNFPTNQYLFGYWYFAKWHYIVSVNFVGQIQYRWREGGCQEGCWKFDHWLSRLQRRDRGQGRPVVLDSPGGQGRIHFRLRGQGRKGHQARGQGTQAFPVLKRLRKIPRYLHRWWFSTYCNVKLQKSQFQLTFITSSPPKKYVWYSVCLS